MTDKPRLFASAEDIRRTGRAMLDRTLPKPEWTHEAHLATFLWLLVERPEIKVDEEVAALISRYNAAAGGENDDTQGYHDTITRAFLAGIRAHIARTPGMALADRVNALLLADEGKRDWPLRFYSRERLFSVAARRGFVQPDLAPLP